MTPLRLSLLGGPRGAGKTTWLQHNILHGPLGGAQAIAAVCAVDDLEAHWLARLKRLAGESGDGSGPRHAVLELDPLAAPDCIARALRADRDLAGLVTISETLTLIDASLGAAALIADRRTRLQALAAAAFILAKLDACTEISLKTLIATLRLLNPNAALFGAVRGVERDLPSDYGARPEIPPDLGAESDGLALTSACVEIDAGLGWPAFSLWLSALLHARGGDVLRVRACVGAPSGGVLLLGASGAALAAEVVHQAPPGGGGHIVMMGSGFRAEDLARSLQTFVRAQE